MPQISDSIGRVLGTRYRLLSALGTGASAHVFLAEDVSLQRHVAVKVLLPGLASDTSFLKRFGAEARSVASLNHPHILRVFDWGEDTDGPYLVTEYLGGGSLRDLLDRGVRLSHSQAAQLGAEVAQGLAYAHSRGLVHRDIKPANLLFDEEGRVRVADFGVARALAEAAWTEPAGAMVGTARYASPESAEGKKVDGRADVYSLALVLYEAVTGTVPFVADTTMGTLMARVGRSVAPQCGARAVGRGAVAGGGTRGRGPPRRRRPGRPTGRVGQCPADPPAPSSPPSPTRGAAAHERVPPARSGRPDPGGGADGADAPVGTRAGPGEVFDAELTDEKKRRRKPASGATGGGAVVAPRPQGPPQAVLDHRRRHLGAGVGRRRPGGGQEQGLHPVPSRLRSWST